MNKSLIQTILVLSSWYHVSIGALAPRDVNVQQLFIDVEIIRVKLGHILEDRLSPDQSKKLNLHQRRQLEMQGALDRGILLYRAYQENPIPDKIPVLTSFVVSRKQLISNMYGDMYCVRDGCYSTEYFKHRICGMKDSK